MNAIVDRLVIGYGSESGNARTLAQRLEAEPALQGYAPRAVPLNEVSYRTLNGRDALVIISSSFGDGEPPANAENFLAEVRQASSLNGLRYAIFGLGDTSYPQFCGFTRHLDQVLQERQAHALINRVDADASYAQFFGQWKPVLEQVLQGDAQAGQNLLLRVTAYGEKDAWPAPLIERRQLNQGAPGAWHIRLSTAGSGMVWRAGDTLHLLPENEPQLLAQIADWYGAPQAAELLQRKELRQISKTVLRELARLSDNETLKSLLKFSQRKALDDYLWGADILDLLEDFCTPDNVPLQTLAELLSSCLPRAYSIASHGDAGYIDLCVREVTYERKGRLRHGVATHWLLNSAEPIRIFCRSNPGFHLPAEPHAPLILIGTGTGIAPLMGLLREMQADGQQRESCLIFGERHRDRDFLYRDELRAMQDEGVLGQLFTAFSRDGSAKYYVQHAISDQQQHLRAMLERGAHIYVCGNKRHLERSIAAAIDEIMADSESLPADDTGWQMLTREGRIHQELY